VKNPPINSPQVMNDVSNVDVIRLQEIARDWSENDYYNNAESVEWLAPFWDETTAFRRLYESMDRSSIVELACGRGRHAWRIMSGDDNRRPSRMYLLDVDAGNVDYCIRRFSAIDQIKVSQNNGYDFNPLEADCASAIFCYDAMVHFEYDCVISYIKDAYRILKPGGRALFHHSNLDVNPGAHYQENPHWRNFMSRTLFAHVGRRSGFRVLEQVELPWGEDNPVADIDCLTLLEKPATVSAHEDMKEQGHSTMISKLDQLPSATRWVRSKLTRG
jgi:SAM-dependent methyltransferase